MTEPETPSEPVTDTGATNLAADIPATPGRVARVYGPARRAIRSMATGVVAATEPVVDALGRAVDGVERTIAERPGARVRRVRRSAARPLAFLNDVHPDVRHARPVQVGLRTIPVDEIAGTAVGGGDQRGGDFLPLKPFRGRNWTARWARLRRAQDELAILPPIDVLKHRGRYWVVDGHNRVGLALYSGQPEIDAEIVELVAPGERRSEPILTLAPTAAGSRALRTAATGVPLSDALGHEDSPITQPEVAPEPEVDLASAPEPEVDLASASEPDHAANPPTR